MSNETNNNEYLLKVDHLKQYFPVHDGFKKMELKAVDDVSFAIKPGETLGLVGESGCGKTTVGRTLLRLYQPTAGRIEFDGNVLFDSEKKIDVDMHPYRKQMQMVFQDPYSSLNPRMTVEDIIGEPLDVHKLYSSKKERHEMIMDLMETVGLNADHATRYAHEFSGGQRQRIGIARALAVDPKFIVCDEPVSALDVSIQAQVVNMFEDLQKERGLSYLFIAHDLLVVQHISDRIAVMYLGHMMELADADELTIQSIRTHSRCFQRFRSRILRLPDTASESCLREMFLRLFACLAAVHSVRVVNMRQNSVQQHVRSLQTEETDIWLHASTANIRFLPAYSLSHMCRF